MPASAASSAAPELPVRPPCSAELPARPGARVAEPSSYSGTPPSIAIGLGGAWGSSPRLPPRLALPPWDGHQCCSKNEPQAPSGTRCRRDASVFYPGTRSRPPGGCAGTAPSPPRLRRTRWHCCVPAPEPVPPPGRVRTNRSNTINRLFKRMFLPKASCRSRVYSCEKCKINI